MATTLEEIWDLFKQVAQSQQKTDRRFQETDRRFQASVTENEKILQRLSRQIGDLGGTWGLFVENLVAPACETLFLERGIPVHQVSQRIKKRKDGETLEIDILVLNQEHTLVVEVKSRLSVADVQEFITNLQRFRPAFRRLTQGTR